VQLDSRVTRQPGADPGVLVGAIVVEHQVQLAAGIGTSDLLAVRLAKVLGIRSVDAGGGWLIFALPPAELAVHPAEGGGRAELYLLCDDVAATVAALQAEGIEIARPVSDQGWGLLTAIALPGGVELGLYQPRHPTAAQPS
jgi:hypothetical protein